MPVVIAALLILIAVGIHYEALRGITWLVPRVGLPPRPRVACFVLFALVAHVVETFVFAVGYHGMIEAGLGSIQGGVGDFRDVFYYSVVSYTSLGFGDLVPEGPIRLVSGLEALVGLVLIGWTAALTYIEMREFWVDF